MAGFSSKYMGTNNREIFYRAYMRFIGIHGLPFWNVELADVSDGLKEATEIASVAPDGHRHIEIVKNVSHDDMQQSLMWVLLDQYEQWKAREAKAEAPAPARHPVYR